MLRPIMLLVALAGAPLISGCSPQPVSAQSVHPAGQRAELLSALVGLAASDLSSGEALGACVDRLSEIYAATPDEIADGMLSEPLLEELKTFGENQWDLMLALDVPAPPGSRYNLREAAVVYTVLRQRGKSASLSSRALLFLMHDAAAGRGDPYLLLAR